jgi:natural product precursor
MKKIAVFEGKQLSNQEMKNLKGGLTLCSAWCNDGSGAWTAYYTTYDGILNSLNTYCSGSGGSYYCQGPLQ